MAVDVAHASTSACGTFASRCGLWLRAAWRIGQACKGRKQGRKEGWEQRLKSVECLSAGCLGASVCYISCSHFEFFKWLLGPAYTQTHIHTSSVYLTDTQSERGTYWLASSNQRHVDVQFSRCWFVSQDFCPRSQPPFPSSPPSYSPRTRLSVTQPFCYTFLQCAFYVFLVCVFRCCLFFLLSAFWGQAFPSRQKNPNMFTRDLWRGIFVYVAFLRRRLRLFRRLCFASGSPRLRQVYLRNRFQ